MVQILNGGPRLKLIGKVVLERGLNEVEAERWKVCVRHGMTQIFLETGMIRVVPGTGPPGTPDRGPVAEMEPATPRAEPETVPVQDTLDDEPETLETDSEPTLSAKELIARVKVSTNESYLETLLGSEHRTTVRAAIIARLDSLPF